MNDTWIPKYCRRILKPDVAAYIQQLLPGIFTGMPGTKLVKINIIIDHVHMIAVVPPKYAVCDVVGRIKGRTASMLLKKFEWLSRVYWKEKVVWSPGYSVGVNEAIILRYVEYQQQQDSGQAKLDF